MSDSPVNRFDRRPRAGAIEIPRRGSRIGSVLAAALLVVAVDLSAQGRTAPDTYTAVTTNMSPSGVELKADILEWSDEDARAAVIEAISESEDAGDALAELPTVGVVWRSGSAVGSAIKYAARSNSADGAEQVVLVTDKPVGATSFNPWTVEGIESEPLDYSVILLDRPANGTGSGTLSLAAEVVLDADAAVISLRQQSGAPMLLAEVRLEPKPYWAREGGESVE
jgi:hypothetical protein